MDFAYLRQQMEHNAGRIAALCRHISDEQARFKPRPGDWSILEVINHLYELESKDFRSHLNFVLHPEGNEWAVIDPQAWITEHGYNQRDPAASLQNFLDERQRSLLWIDSLGAVDWDKAYTSEYGTMLAGEMFSCWVAHDGLHLRQLVELHRAYVELATKPYDLGYAGEW